MDVRLDGKVAVITGGGSGLGYAMAEAMTAAGAHAVIVGRREEVLRRACELLGSSASFITADISRPDDVERLVEIVTNDAGGADILVNNAGVHLKRPIEQTTFDEFDRVLKTHVYGAFSITKGLVPGMVRKSSGAILFIASMTTFIGMPSVVAYSAAKSAYGGMVRSLASELSPRGIRVNGVAPGWIETQMLHQAIDDDEERTNKILSRTPMAKFGRPEDIGNAAVFLCSDAAAYITGVILPVDGGAAIGF